MATHVEDEVDGAASAEGFYRTALRSHGCGELRAAHSGQEVALAGWVDRRRDQGGILFVDLRDRYGRIQLVFNAADAEVAHERAGSLSPEDVVTIQGRVRLRPEGTTNRKLATGDVEVVVTHLDVVSESEPLPFEVSASSSGSVTGETRLRHRVVDLRRPMIQKRFEVRHQVCSVIRRTFDRLGFIDIETPYLTRSTPEGARDFVVPNRRVGGTFFALPQSPQLFKQLLMVAGYDRYYQVVRCFRDEDLRADRQPEFTQLDMEMAFVEPDDVFAAVEEVVSEVFREVHGLELQRPFPRLAYAEAMSRYGSDKPDLRYGLEIHDVSGPLGRSGFGVFSGAVEKGGRIGVICVPGGSKSFSRKDLDGLPAEVRDTGAKGVAWAKVEAEGLKGPFAKHVADDQRSEVLETTGAKPGDLLLVVADAAPEVTLNALGTLRQHLARRLSLIPEDSFALTWVVDFPLFDRDLSPMHHPFTAPRDEDLNLLDSEPVKVRAKAYDLVLNGVELGGGSIRIHDREVQQKIFSILGIDAARAQDKFGFLLKAFRYGAPPHGGIALGLDRLVLLVLGLDDIRDVIAFPKTHAASCMLTGAPSDIDSDQLTELSLKILASPPAEAAPAEAEPGSGKS